jgi:hypothetical protein
MRRATTVHAALIAALASVFSVVAANAHDNAEPQAMLRAARRYADEANRGKKEPDGELPEKIAEEQFRAGDVESARDTLRAATVALPVAST